MQKLHLVGFTTDHSGLIFSTRKGARSGSFVVPLDTGLRRALAELERLQHEEPVDADDLSDGPVARPARPQSELSVREMQDRLRTGMTIDEVAAEAGVDSAWVERFADPILAEQARVVAAARQLVFDKPRFGTSAEPLGAAVRWNVADRGVVLTDDAFAAGWSAYQLGGGLWAIRFRYVSRGRQQEAEWTFDIEEERLTSRNRLGAQLGYVARARSGRPPAAPPGKADDATATGSRAAGRATKRGSGRRAGAKKAGAKRTTTTRGAAKKSAGKRAGAKRAGAKRAATKRAGVKRAAGKKAAGKRAATKRAATKRAAAKKAATKRAAGKRAATKRAATKRAAAKKAATKRAGVKRAAGKRAGTKRTAAKKSATKRAGTKRATAKKAGGKRTAAKKTAGRTKAAGKRAGTNRTRASESSAARAPSTRAAAKKSGARRSAARKTSGTRKSGSTRAPSRRPAGKRAGGRKAAADKVPPVPRWAPAPPGDDALDAAPAAEVSAAATVASKPPGPMATAARAERLASPEPPEPVAATEPPPGPAVERVPPPRPDTERSGTGLAAHIAAARTGSPARADDGAVPVVTSTPVPGPLPGSDPVDLRPTFRADLARQAGPPSVDGERTVEPGEAPTPRHPRPRRRREPLRAR